MNKTFVLSALALSSTLAFAHAKLQASTPASGAVVSPAPAELRLHYDEPVEAAMSSIRLLGADDKVIATARIAADPSDEKSLVQALPKLAPGDYRAQWSTMGHDGHHVKGEIRFTVK